jgi:aminoglycoside phosphotransferase family enzyme/predicted kinase
VFLTRDRVYKFRRPVDLGFLNFEAQSERNADCLREVALNRRLAPDVYLGIAPLRSSAQGMWVGPIAERPVGDVEHCVVMRRLPAGRDALSLLDEGCLEASMLERFAARIAALHRDECLGTPAPFSPEAWVERCVGPVHASLGSLATHGKGVVPRSSLQRASELTRRFEGEHAERFERRRRAGRAVEGHGDLHLQHVWFETDEPIAIDCLEFDDGLRRIDAASDVAFLVMDLRYRDADALAATFLSAYAAESDDYDLYGMVDYFSAYRAIVRAKVAAIAALDPGIEPDQRERAAASACRHMELAVRVLEPSVRGGIVAVGGTVGSGKTSVAGLLASALGAAAISSDRVRKRLLGLEASAPAPASAYTREARSRVYAALRERAERVLESGRHAILDATWGERGERERVLELARRHGVPALFVEVRCDPEIAAARLARRAANGTSASDAGPGLLDASRAGFQPPSEWPGGSLAVVETDAGDWRDRVRSIAESFKP